MIKCKAITNKSIFISSYGDLYPCCWMFKKHPDGQAGVTEFKTPDDWQNLADNWDSNPHRICSRICDTDSDSDWSLDKFDAQFKK